MTAKNFVLCSHCQLHAVDRCSCGRLVCANHHRPDETGALVCPGCSDMVFPPSVFPKNKYSRQTDTHRGHTITVTRIDDRGWISRLDGEHGLACHMNEPYSTAEEAIAAGRERIDAKLDLKKLPTEKQVVKEPVTEEEPTTEEEQAEQQTMSLAA